MSKSSILFLLHYPPPVHGAAMVGQYIRESRPVNTSFTCKYINLGTSNTVDEIGKGGLKKWWRFISIVAKTLVALLFFRPQLVYITLNSHGGGFYKDAMIALLVKIFGKKIVYHFHNKGVARNQDKWVDNFLYRIVFKNAYVILLSKYLYPDIEKYVPENRVFYCANGIPSVAQDVEVKAKNVQPGELLFLSNLIESKGLYILLEALSVIYKKGIPFHCTIVGGEGDVTAQQLQQKIQYFQLADTVSYAGKKYGKEKAEQFDRAAIFVFPTYYFNETFGLVLIEAMQMGLPVISTFEGGIPDVVADGVTGYLVPQKDVHALVEKIEYLILNPELQSKMGASGKKRYEERFTLEQFEKRFTNILSELVQSERN
ncbi:MAG TPA: glycosyltransferase family 4 protein [Niabella sp.]|nr:glycosyltransferase family 4 protein [Niabella sp.]